jgi:hypothetical protein
MPLDELPRLIELLCIIMCEKLIVRGRITKWASKSSVRKAVRWAKIQVINVLRMKQEC